MEDRLRAIMGDMLGIGIDEVNSETAFEQTPSWDSLAHINLVSALEAEFDVTFSIQEIEAMLTYDDVLATVSAKL